MRWWKRIVTAWRLARINREFEFWQGALPKLEALKWAIPEKLEAADVFIPKLDALERVLSRLESMGARMPSPEEIDALADRLEALDSTVARIEALGTHPKPVMVYVASNGDKPKAKVDQVQLAQKHEWDRLKLLSRFVQAAEQSQKLEQDWQKIQQGEHDAFFEFQSMNKDDSKVMWMYKKGVSDGVKWCINRFS